MRKQKEDIKLIMRGMKVIRRISPGLSGAVLLQSVFTALSPFVTMYMASVMINGIQEGMEAKRLLLLAAVTVTANLLVHLLGSFFGHFVNVLRHRFWSECEMMLGRKMMELDYEDVESFRIHQLRQQMQDFRDMGGEGLENILYQFQDMVRNLFTLVFSLSFVLSLFTAGFQGEASGILAFAVSPVSSLLLILAVLANAFGGMFLGRKMTEKSHILLRDSTEANRIYGYYLENHIMTYHTGKDVRLYNQKALLLEEARRVYDVGARMVGRQVRNEAKYTGAVAFFTVALSTLVYLFVGFRALAGMIGVGEVVLYIGSISRFTEGFSGFVMGFTRLLANNDAMRVYFEFLDTPVRMAGTERGKEDISVAKTQLTSTKKHEVEFRDVSFRYPDSENWTLRHVSMKFRAGERLAVVGRNGSGKTTFIKLLCRLYDPTEGSILLDGVDIRRIDMEEYRKIFSVVFQDYKLFSFSLAQNVAARTQTEPDRVIDCLERAGFGPRLSEMPLGIETCLYRDFRQDGVEISGGEAQKIALARALYKDAPIVILDEPTAALDPVAEYEIYSRFDDIVGDKTAIYISHRLSSCRFCDDIVVFRGGELVQRGRHEELVALKEGEYYELWEAQARHYA